MKEKNLILGAGPAGMACVRELSNHNETSFIIEKDVKVGGLAKTLEFREKNSVFRTDIGPHRFFSKNPYLYEFIENILGNDWMLIKRQTRQYIDGKFYDYPINAVQAFKNIGFFRAADMGFSYFFGVVKFRVFKRKIKTFEDYTVANFGKKLGEFNMLNYTEKIWGIPSNQLHPDWAKQRIKGLNLTTALKDAIFKKKGKDSPKTLVDSFYYPRYGTGQIYETIANEAVKKGSLLKTESFPTKIYHSKNRITKVELNIKGEVTYAEPENVVASIPITQLIGLLNPSPPKQVLNAVGKLRWRAQVYLFLTINKKRISNDNWIYFPNKDIPFARISEIKNFSEKMCPEDKTSLFIEYFVYENDNMWNMNKEDLFNLTLRHLEKTKLLKKSDVNNYYLLKNKHVYPVYDLNYEKHLKVIKTYLDTFSNLYYIGRPGRYQYTNQDHSLEMGILAAKSIIEKKRYDFEKIGTEKDYFEKGYITTTRDKIN